MINNQEIQGNISILQGLFLTFVEGCKVIWFLFAAGGMLVRGGSFKNIGVLVLFLIIGSVLGGIIGEMISSAHIWPGFSLYMVKQFVVLDVPPVAINLYVIKFTIGFSLHPNLISIIGLIVAALLFRRF